MSNWKTGAWSGANYAETKRAYCRWYQRKLRDQYDLYNVAYRQGAPSPTMSLRAVTNERFDPKVDQPPPRRRKPGEVVAKVMSMHGA